MSPLRPLTGKNRHQWMLVWHLLILLEKLPILKANTNLKIYLSEDNLLN
jgi:hypothetical protein